MISKALKNLDVALDSNKCIAKWSNGKYTGRNIGDVLNVYLFKKVFDKDIVSFKDTLNLGFPPVYSFIGSVLDRSAVKNLIVMGSGFKKESSIIKVKPKKVIACRGPLTRKKLIDAGSDVPEVYGDPAILLPRYFNPHTDKKFKMGIIPHYVDKDLEIIKKWEGKGDVKIIDVFAGMEKFITDIKSCDFTISSSLHGVILSHAYGIPSGWVKLSDKLAGGGFKFSDYYQSVNTTFAPLELTEYNSINEIYSKTILPDLTELSDQLFKTLKNYKI